MVSSTVIPGSFRDPGGFVFTRDDEIYRQINHASKDDYDYLIASGLYEDLTNAGLLVSHEETDDPAYDSLGYYKIIKPKCVPFISYPYEWCFSQLKAAALATLQIQKMALERGMSLKDCSAYNIQFIAGEPVHIDTLSFAKYKEGEPWVAYRQFCQHFLAPLALMAHTDIRLSQLLSANIDGIPLDLASRLLPFSTRFDLSLLSHIHFHSKSQKDHAGKAVKRSDYRLSRLSFLGLIDSLESGVRKLKWQPRGTEWADYYNATNYTEAGLEHKKALVGQFLDQVHPAQVWDLGANTGAFSRIAAEKGIQTYAFDVDTAAVELNYLDCVRRKESRILPLILNLTNPTPAVGWDHEERMSWRERGPVDMVFALALIHHLAISNNVPLGRIAELFHKTGEWLVIEFIPKSDSQVKRLLATREDIFPNYTQEAFEGEFSNLFSIRASERVGDSERTLYLMKRLAA